MLWRADRGPNPAELTDGLAIVVFDYVHGWQFAGFVLEVGTATVAEATKFAASADPAVAGRPMFAKRIQASDMKFPRRTVTQPAPTVDVTVEDYVAPPPPAPAPTP